MIQWGICAIYAKMLVLVDSAVHWAEKQPSTWHIKARYSVVRFGVFFFGVPIIFLIFSYVRK